MTYINIDLEIIARHSTHWPSNQDILHDGNNGLHVAVHASPTPDTLPHHLDRIRNSENRTRTRDGAVMKLRHAWQLWGKPKPPTQTKGDEYDLLCAAMLTHTQTYYQLPKQHQEQIATILANLARDTLRVTAHDMEPLGLWCPECKRNELGRPFTSEGILDLAICPTCGQWWSMADLEAYAKASARYGNTSVPVTISEAARMLDESVKTLSARVRRQQISPIGRRGKRRLYSLSDLRQ